MKTYLLDANLYVSYFTVRNREQFEVAQKYIQALEKGTAKIVLPSLILSEVVYVLHKMYGQAREQVSESLISLVSEEGLVMENKDVALTALYLFGSENISFADCYIFACHSAGGVELVTFDKQLRARL